MPELRKKHAMRVNDKLAELHKRFGAEIAVIWSTDTFNNRYGTEIAVTYVEVHAIIDNSLYRLSREKANENNKNTYRPNGLWAALLNAEQQINLMEQSASQENIQEQIVKKSKLKEEVEDDVHRYEKRVPETER